MATFNLVTWSDYVGKINTVKELNVAVKMLHKTNFPVPQAAWTAINDKATALNCYYLRSVNEYRKSHHPSQSTTSNESTT